MRQLQLLALVGSLSLLHTPTAHAYSVSVGAGEVVARWAGMPITLRLPASGSDNLPPGEALTALRAALARWEAPDCSAVSFVVSDVGSGPAGATVVMGGPQDGVSELVFVEDGWPFGRYVLGVTTPIVTEAGLVEGDIAFNGQDVLWTTHGGGGIDLEAVALHEVGHLLGLGHNLGPFDSDRQPTMAPQIANRAESRSLEADDVAGICFLYPRGEARACASDADCPDVLDHDNRTGEEHYGGRFHCSAAGRCDELERYVAGGSTLGDRCGYMDACATGLWCQPTPGGPTCTRSCLPGGAECGEGFRCAIGEGPFDDAGVCLPVGGAPFDPGTGPRGCLLSAVCPSGQLCLPTPTGDRRLCAPLCKVDDPGSCAEGTRCQTYGTPNGGCFAEGLFPGVEPPVDTDATELDAVTPDDDAAGDDAAAEDASADTAEADATTTSRRGGGCAGAADVALPWVAIWSLCFALGGLYTRLRRPS